MPERILVVAHDRALGESRVAFLEGSGYEVLSTKTGAEAMLLENPRFALVVLGRKANLPMKDTGPELREKYPTLSTLKIDHVWADASPFPSPIKESLLGDVLAALRYMLA